MELESFITNDNIEELLNEVKISNILLANTTNTNYKFFFNPIIKHNKSLNILNQHNSNKYHLIEKEKRNLITKLPLTYKSEILNYLNETINILLEHNLYIPLTNKTIYYDITNKIPIVVSFKKGIVITRWQNKNDFKTKYHDDMNTLLFTN